MPDEPNIPSTPVDPTKLQPEKPEPPLVTKPEAAPNQANRDRVYQELGGQPIQAAPEAPLPADTPRPSETPAQTPEQPQADPNLIFGKYKTMEEAEKGYKEAQQAFHAKAQALAQTSQERDYLKQFVDVSKLQQGQANVDPSQQPQPQGQQAIDWLDLMVNTPDKFPETAANQILPIVTSAMQTQQLLNNWEKQNPDLTNHKHFVNAEVQRLAQEQPDLIQDGARLLTSATENIRNTFNMVRAEGKTETLQMQNETHGTSISTVPQSAGGPEQPAPQTPVPADPVDTVLAERRKILRNRTGGFVGSGIGRLVDPRQSYKKL
jgi:hypothetical protein